MIYRNEDGSIYKIEVSLCPALPTENQASEITVANRRAIEEIAEILNVLIKRLQKLEATAVKVPLHGEPSMPDPRKAADPPDADLSNPIKKGGKVEE